MSERLRVLVAATDFAGHAFPEIALAGELHERGHEVHVETSERWRDAVEGLGPRLLAVEDLPAVEHHGTFGEPLAEVAAERAGLMRELRPDVVVCDIATAAPPLAAEAAGVRWASLVPTVYPPRAPGYPPYGSGLHPPRTALGRAGWRAAAPAIDAVRPAMRWRRRVPVQHAEARVRLGVAAENRTAGATTAYGPLSAGLTLVATYPQLEYPRRWPAYAHVTGPMIFELAHPDVELPAGPEPLVLVASSTVQDPEHTLLHDTLEALAGEPVRVLATINSPGVSWAGPVPGNATVVDWISYAQVMPHAALVICSGGHGTLTRALAAGAPVLVAPRGGDTPETGARVAWAGAGLMLPRRLLAPGALRRAVARMLADPGFEASARRIAAWGRAHDGAAAAAKLVESYARAG